VIGDALARRPTVLVAESHADLHPILADILESAGYEPRFAVDGIELVGMVARAAPDLLVLDLDLDRLDGLLALELVRAIARQLPIVLTSSLGGPSVGLAARRLGVLAVLRKPFDNADLLDAVGRGLAARDGASQHDGAGASAPVVTEPSPTPIA
jgi:two-component system OmpR family response regulator